MLISTFFFQFNLKPIHFDNYKAILSCVNYDNAHWKFLVSEFLVAQMWNMIHSIFFS